ncbi:general substrate transporter [Coprinopsis sp. MPI-PUGE-AT-0042]|nr:general substrate transporter [Coprinopsis sp. MPI-PUGE-AT-0042]
MSVPNAYRKSPIRFSSKCMTGSNLLYSATAATSLADAIWGFGQGAISSALMNPRFIETMYGSVVTFHDLERGHIAVNPFLHTITSHCLNATAFLSCFASAYVCDTFGRRMALRLGAFLFLVASVIQASAPSLTAMIFGRSVQGLGVGILSMTVPIYECELLFTLSCYSRGTFIAGQYLCLNAGYALSAWVGYAFLSSVPSDLSWRGLYILQSGLGLAVFLWTFFIPETPIWLIERGFQDEASNVLSLLHQKSSTSDPAVLHASSKIQRHLDLSLPASFPATWRELCTRYKSQMNVANAVQKFAQTNGVNAILAFLPSYLLPGGVPLPKALLYVAGASLVSCSGTIPAMMLVDRMGRKKLLILGSIGLCVSIGWIGLLHFKGSDVTESAKSAITKGLFAGTCFYLFVYGATWGPTSWLIAAEIFPIQARAKGMALSTSINWMINLILAIVTPPLFSVMHEWFYMLLFGSCLASGIVVWFIVPENPGKSLEGAGDIFKMVVTDEKNDIHD